MKQLFCIWVLSLTGFNEELNWVEYPPHAWVVSQALRWLIKFGEESKSQVVPVNKKQNSPEWFPTWILGHLLLKSIRGNPSRKPVPPAMALSLQICRACCSGRWRVLKAAGSISGSESGSRKQGRSCRYKHGSLWILQYSTEIKIQQTCFVEIVHILVIMHHYHTRVAPAHFT